MIRSPSASTDILEEKVSAPAREAADSWNAVVSRVRVEIGARRILKRTNRPSLAVAAAAVVTNDAKAIGNGG